MQNYTLVELAILCAIAANPTITQKEPAVAIAKYERTIKSGTIGLQDNDYLRCKMANRMITGRWTAL